MKYVKEMVIIFGITLAGEVLNQLIPLPVPAGVYGLFLLLGLLCSGIVSLPDVEHVGGLLLDLMPLMFIPAAVGIIEQVEELQSVLIPVLFITVATTFIVMAVTGKVTELVLKRENTRSRVRCRCILEYLSAWPHILLGCSLRKSWDGRS